MPAAPPEEELRLDGGTLRWGERAVSLDAIVGLRERYDPWTGRAWLELRGPGWRVPVDERYAARRRLIREAVPDRPLTSDWSDGRFPAAPLGLPGDAILALVVGLVLLVALAAAWQGGIAAAVLVIGAATWPLARLRDTVVVRRDGLAVGPAWVPLVPWHEIPAVCVRREGRGARVWARGVRGAGMAVVPVVLLPALRARVRRLGGLVVEEARPDLDDRYARWVGPASGIPWGVLVATGAAVTVAAEPWPVLAAGLLAVAGTGLLGAAVEARATGWGAGALLWSSSAYAVVLVALALGLGGWLQG